jgi:hypothetical protein
VNIAGCRVKGVRCKVRPYINTFNYLWQSSLTKKMAIRV